MTYLFISDLHLSPNHPRLVRGFLALLEHYQDQDTQLYILGDWFNAWIGDDDHTPWLDNIVKALQIFNCKGNQIYFLAGNRDFALGQTFLNQFNGILLPEIDVINVFQYQIRIEHGDALCTDDLAYQRFRKIIRNPFLLRLLKTTPLSFRQKIAQGFRQRSQQSQKNKNHSIMDVNTNAVLHALCDVDLLIHGHTHRAHIHQLQQKQRIVLGDWRENSAEILVLHSNKMPWQLSTWHY